MTTNVDTNDNSSPYMSHVKKWVAAFECDRICLVDNLLVQTAITPEENLWLGPIW